MNNNKRSKEFSVSLLVFFVLISLNLFIPNLHAAKAAAPSSDLTEMKKALPPLSDPFIENQGQMDKEATYYAKTFRGNLFVTKKSGMVYSLPVSNPSFDPTKQTKGTKETFTLIERIPGTPHILEFTPSPTNVSSFIGNDSSWKKAIPTYSALSMGEMTPGITVTIEYRTRQVKTILQDVYTGLEKT